MGSNRLNSMEQMVIQVAESFVDLLIAEQVSVKRFSDLVFAGAVQALKKKGLSMQEIISHSGAAAKTVKKYLRDEYHDKKGDILVVRFLDGWASDPDLPKEVSLSGESFPDWHSICSRHGGELTPNFLKRTLLASGNIAIRGDRVSLVSERYATQSRSGVTYDYVGWVLAHHIRSISHNVNHPTDPLLERTIYGMQIKPERREELREFWKEELSVALAKARETAREKGFYDNDLPKDNELGVTVFMWDERALT
ncbi:MAG: hypothetical protein AAGA23_14095 [Pseudomonadota bacterium]